MNDRDVATPADLGRRRRAPSMRWLSCISASTTAVCVGALLVGAAAPPPDPPGSGSSAAVMRSCTAEGFTGEARVAYRFEQDSHGNAWLETRVLAYRITTPPGSGDRKRSTIRTETGNSQTSDAATDGSLLQDGRWHASFLVNRIPMNSHAFKREIDATVRFGFDGAGGAPGCVVSDSEVPTQQVRTIKTTTYVNKADRLASCRPVEGPVTCTIRQAVSRANSWKALVGADFKLFDWLTLKTTFEHGWTDTTSISVSGRSDRLLPGQVFVAWPVVDEVEFVASWKLFGIHSSEQRGTTKHHKNSVAFGTITES